MGATRLLVVRVSKIQKDRIVQDSLIHGYKTYSDYVRKTMLSHDQSLLTKVDEIYKTIVPIISTNSTPKERPLMSYFKKIT